MGIDGHARGRYIQQDDAAFYRITSISFFHVYKYASHLLRGNNNGIKLHVLYARFYNK